MKRATQGPWRSISSTSGEAQGPAGGPEPAQSNGRGGKVKGVHWAPGRAVAGSAGGMKGEAGNLEDFRSGSPRSGFSKDRSAQRRSQRGAPPASTSGLTRKPCPWPLPFSHLQKANPSCILGRGNRDGDQYTQARAWCFSLLFKNSASLPFAKAEAALLLRLEFIKASNMINNLYTWIVIQKNKE